MHYTNWQNYIYSLEQKMQKQALKIKQLEQRLNMMEDQVEKFRNNAQPSVEKIEYHFDQLKIETLEGTLNIGLSPQGLSADELSIPTPNANQDIQQNPLIPQIMDELRPFIQDELPSKFKLLAAGNNKSYPPGFENMVYQDIHRQLPQRIHHYFRLHSENNNGILNSDTKDKIVEDVKKEIMHSVKNFVENKGGA